MKAQTKNRIGKVLGSPLWLVAILWFIMAVFISVLPLLPAVYKWPSLPFYVVALFAGGFSLRMFSRKLINAH
ncbi:hypothetical protein LCGC14_1191480 [marine sediment metagenome]|uniref:Uncharacterized protein n=1 Tax=marine sediment metagenome TaxID=412755 RepID=A0A0F9P1W5_9ZZZZ